MTASAFSSVSLDPPMVLVCINRAASTAAAVAENGSFAVNILSEHQGLLASQFARPASDKFAGVAVKTGNLGCPLVVDALATLECRVTQAVTGGTHEIFLAEVIWADSRDGEPLTYFRGQLGHFLCGRFDGVTTALRERLLSGIEPIGTTLDLVRLGSELGAAVGDIQGALGSLLAEGLIARTADGELMLPPLTDRALDDMLQARLAIELGAAELSVGNASASALATLRVAMERTEELAVDGRISDIVSYALANTRFHHTLVGLAGCPALLDAYRQLTLPGALVRGLQADDANRMPRASKDHRHIVEAYERGDLDAARCAIRAHSESSRASTMIDRYARKNSTR
jgi:flavin reductase (DIM6/NTAB) family NADH-FMN oxidoreductase RutF